MGKLALITLLFIGIFFSFEVKAQSSTTPSLTEQAMALRTGSTLVTVGSTSNATVEMANLQATMAMIDAKKIELDQAAAQNNITKYNHTLREIARLESKADGIVTAIQKFEAQNAEKTPSLCTAPEQTAQKTCTLGLSDEQMGALRLAINNASMMMTSGGTEKACKAAATVQQLTGIANMAHATACQVKVSSCLSACKAALNTPNIEPAQKTATTKSLNKCRELQGNVIAAGLSAMNNVLAFAASKQCQKAVTNNTNPGGTPPQPYDCNHPMMSGQPQCVCAANPADPVCSGNNAGLGDGAGFASGDPGLGQPGTGWDVKNPEGIDFEDEIAALDSNGGQGVGAPGGGGGGGGPSGGGAGALPPEESGGPGAGPYNTDIMGGLTGGGGGGGGGSFGSSGGGSDSDGGSMLSSLAEKFNLKGFLPSKADFKNRGLAAGGGADGITGPNGPSLFEKVSSRYQKKQSELLP